MLQTQVKIEKTNQGIYAPIEQALLNYYAERLQKALYQMSGTEETMLASAIRDAEWVEGAIQEFIATVRQIAATPLHSFLLTEAGRGTHSVPENEFQATANGCKIKTDGLTGQDTAEAKPTQQQTSNIGVGGITGCIITSGTANRRILNPGKGNAINGKPEFAAGLFQMATGDMDNINAKPMAGRESSHVILYKGQRAYVSSRPPAPSF
uniref:Variant surface glycoprotein n=1 Tax=Trypanosoma brucei TaxID=5691 RepID=A0A1V0FZF3_9TRYP|nr:variant surface glycoprotein [Trypanosoma brucei]